MLARRSRPRSTPSGPMPIQKATGNKVNYQSIGSGGGIKQITAKTVDFGASDKPLSQENLDKDGLAQFPTVIGGVVPVVNLPGFQPGALHLTGQVLADIYLGKITRWNDKAIAELNPKADAAGSRHPGRASRRRLVHHVHLHQLPVEGQPGVEEQGW